MTAPIKVSISNLNPERISISIQKLARAASGNHGSDCFLHAALAQRALKELHGIQTKLVIGFASWRVGNGDGDVITHAPIPGIAYQGENALPYHAWLIDDDYLIDFSTYQLRDKAAKLDALDGGVTQVDWCPDYLIVKHKKSSSLKNVAQLNVGLFYYERYPKLEIQIKSESNVLDEDDWRNFMLIYENPDVVVLGPNQF